MDSDSRVVMITGAAGNLGHAVAAAFEQRGERRVLVDLHSDRLAQRFGTDTDRQSVAAANLLEQDDAHAVARRTIERFGRIDVLCNLAGGFAMGEAVHETSDRTWNWMFDINIRTLVHATRAVVPGMIGRGYGKIVNVGAFAAAQRGQANMGAYLAAKATVIRLTESMAAELRNHGINVNAVLPTTLDTPQNRAAMPDAEPSRWVAPQDLANVIAFLASDDAKAVHGAAVPVTGLS
jgi:NAD(P)-dependent dehydrogenase (short-subunit alcohol dehydrogenase family)